MSRARDLADSADLNFDSNTLAIDTANNRVGIGTASPTNTLHVDGTLKVEGSVGTISTDSQGLTLDLNRNGTAGIANQNTGGSQALTFSTGGSEAARIDASANLRFNSGYGSVATAYGCRAWVKFLGSGGGIQGSGNVSSVTYNTTGQNTVNFTNAMPDANYAAFCCDNYYGMSWIDVETTTSVKHHNWNYSAGSYANSGDNMVMVMR